MIHVIMRYLLPLLLLTSFSVFAVEKEASNCASITEPSLRLSCYDSLFRPGQVEDAKLDLSEDSQKPEVVKKEKEIKEERKRRFGLPKKQETPEEKIEIRDKIIKVTQLNSLRLDITLANDQKWRTVEKIRQIRLKPGQEIIISEGFISGYALKVVGKKISIRVRRIK
tara:strand:+ start:262 stop:765 length:504 start_codon:yes stop_codon:yes gene_type:complete